MPPSCMWVNRCVSTTHCRNPEERIKGVMNKGCSTCKHRGNWCGVMPFGKYWFPKAMITCNKCDCVHAVIKKKCKDWESGEAIKKFHWYFVSIDFAKLPTGKLSPLEVFYFSQKNQKSVIATAGIWETDDIYSVYENTHYNVYSNRDKFKKELEKEKKHLLSIEIYCSIVTCDGFESKEEAVDALQEAIQHNESKWRYL